MRACGPVRSLGTLLHEAPHGVAYTHGVKDTSRGGRYHDATTLPIHVGGSTEAAARRAGRRGDGYFPGGMLGPYERARQWELVRKSAVDAGRDPDALEYTRWGSVDLTPDRVAGLAQQGVHRIVVNAGAAELSEQLDALSAFAERHGLVPADRDRGA